MKLSEIILIPSREESIENFLKYFSDSEKYKTEFYEIGKRLDFSFSKDKFDDEYYGLLSDNNLVAILKVDFSRLNKPQIEYVQTSKEYRGQGLLRYLVNVALNKHNELYSDTHQTSESKRFWSMLMKFPQPEFKIYIYDVETNTKMSTSDYVGNVDKEIWNDMENAILLINKQKRFETNEQYEIYLKHQVKRKLSQRDDFNLWYGHYDKNSGYENP